MPTYPKKRNKEYTLSRTSKRKLKKTNTIFDTVFEMISRKNNLKFVWKVVFWIINGSQTILIKHLQLDPIRIYRFNAISYKIKKKNPFKLRPLSLRLAFFHCIQEFNAQVPMHVIPTKAQYVVDQREKKKKKKEAP
jgi:hypothetical protein